MATNIASHYSSFFGAQDLVQNSKFEFFGTPSTQWPVLSKEMNLTIIWFVRTHYFLLQTRFKSFKYVFPFNSFAMLFLLSEFFFKDNIVDSSILAKVMCLALSNWIGRQNVYICQIERVDWWYYNRQNRHYRRKNLLKMGVRMDRIILTVV